jgi:hypothetical protein
MTDVVRLTYQAELLSLPLWERGAGGGLRREKAMIPVFHLIATTFSRTHSACLFGPSTLIQIFIPHFSYLDITELLLVS